MPGITLAQAETQLSNWLAASTAVASGQSYSIDGKQLTRADATAIMEQIKFWDTTVKQLSGRGIKIRGTTIAHI